MDKRDVVRRLLVLMAMLHDSNSLMSHMNKENASKFILEILLKNATSKKPIDYENVKTWVYKVSSTGYTSFPSTHKDWVLHSINSAIFKDNTSAYISDFSCDLNSIEAWKIYGDKVEEHLNGSSSKVVRTNNILIAPDLRQFKPSDIDDQVRNTRSDRALKSYFLYQSIKSPELWNKIKSSENYKPLYECCEIGLRNILSTSEWRKESQELGVVFMLGAGSNIKDRIVLNGLSHNNNFAFVWVDASPSMLYDAMQAINRYDYRHVNFGAIYGDFEAPKRVRDIYNESFTNFPSYSNSRKIFIILGYTLSNLDENNFFTNYASVCNPGDMIIATMHYIPGKCRESSIEADNFKANLLTHYNFKEGQSLARSGLLVLYDYSINEFLRPEVRTHYFNDKSDSMRVIYSARLTHNADKDEKEVITAQSIRHYEKDYVDFLSSKGFEQVLASTTSSETKTLLLKFVGK